MRRKSGRSCHAEGGTPAMQVAKGKPQAAMAGVKKAPSEILATGRPLGVRSGTRSGTPARTASLGKAQAATSGLSSRSLAVGRPTARRSGDARDISLSKPQAKTAGPDARDMAAGRVMGRNYRTGGGVDKELKCGGGLKDERELKRGGRASPRRHASGGGDFARGLGQGFTGVFKGLGHLFGFAEGGSIKDQKAMVKLLHSAMQNDPALKRLGATRKNMNAGLPHRSKSR